jgi:hypothetical protein
MNDAYAKLQLARQAIEFELEVRESAKDAKAVEALREGHDKVEAALEWVREFVTPSENDGQKASS